MSRSLYSHSVLCLVLCSAVFTTCGNIALIIYILRSFKGLIPAEPTYCTFRLMDESSGANMMGKRTLGTISPHNFRSSLPASVSRSTMSQTARISR